MRSAGTRARYRTPGRAVQLPLTGALILPLVVFDRQLLALFLPPASQALDIARHLNHVVIGSFLFFGVSFVISGVVRSTGAVIPPLLILAGSLWGVRVPFAELLQPYWGADAIWWSFPVSSLVSMLLSLAYYRWGGWRKAKMMGRPSHAEELATPSEIPACPPSPVADPDAAPPGRAAGRQPHLSSSIAQQPPAAGSTFFFAALNAARAQQRLERSGIRHRTFMDVDRTPRVALQAGVEQAFGIGQRRTVGEGQFHCLLVGFAGAQDAVVLPHRCTAPLPGFLHVRQRFMDQCTHACQRFAAPVSQLGDACIDQFGRRGSGIVRVRRVRGHQRFSSGKESERWAYMRSPGNAAAWRTSPGTALHPTGRIRGCAGSACRRSWTAGGGGVSAAPRKKATLM